MHICSLSQQQTRARENVVIHIGPKALHPSSDDDNLMKLLVLINFCLYKFQIYKVFQSYV